MGLVGFLLAGVLEEEVEGFGVDCVSFVDRVEVGGVVTTDVVVLLDVDFNCFCSCSCCCFKCCRCAGLTLEATVGDF